MKEPTITAHGFDSPPETFARLDALMEAVFGFSFALWRARGGWGPDYTCHSIESGGAVVANVGVYQMQMLVSGRPRRVLQLSAVAVHPAWRGRGLSRRLMEHVLALEPDTPTILCANESVLDFYPRFGFRAVADRQPVLALAEELGAGETAMLPVAPDDARVGEYLRGRACFSRVLDCTNGAPVQAFNLLMGSGGELYELPGLGVLLAAERRANVLTIFDVVARGPVKFADLRRALAFPGVDTIRFGCNPDWLVEGYAMEAYPDTAHLFAKGAFAVEGDFIFPMLLRT